MAFTAGHGCGVGSGSSPKWWIDLIKLIAVSSISLFAEVLVQVLVRVLA